MYTAFPCADYYAPSDSSCGPWRFVGVSLTYFPLALTSLTKSPVFNMEDSTERCRWRVSLLAPSALCGSPVFGQRVGQVDLCPLCTRPPDVHWSVFSPLVYDFRLDWLTPQTRSVRVRFPVGLSHASGDSPYRSSAKSPPLEGVSPSHGAFQEHAAHIIAWSIMLSSKGSVGACIPKVLPHSSMPLSRRTSGRYFQSAARPL